MTMESDLVTLLKLQCPRVYADVAPLNTAKPYVTWQILGGPSLYMLDNTPADKRQSFVQINVWGSTSRADVLTLIRSIEAAMVPAAAFTSCRPQGEPLSDYEPDTKLYGSIQRFLITALR